MLNEMNKQIEDLRTSQTQQSEEIRKDLGGEISALRETLEKYFANSQPINQREGKQHEEQTSSDLTAAGTEHRREPPDRHALSIFLTNMNQHLALHVRQFNVTTVPAAAQIAKLPPITVSSFFLT
ncbi:hypothetical protein DY000_02063453 [Brassica cretica]|uniref:Uncharacterized protein n=1 Tax=Brassica cretica TaxID=69181 RepID=A0ABQ7ATD9_BRACR|nr:hypothetical protein DY000_02063453 [Brassica cretica]